MTPLNTLLWRVRLAIQNGFANVLRVGNQVSQTVYKHLTSTVGPLTLCTVDLFV